jgi:hypothetical protein
VSAESSTTGATTGTESSTGSSTGSSSTETGAGDLPDIDMTLVAADMQQSAYTETINFPANSCALDEMCVNAAGDRRLLRFDSITPNVGAIDFIVGNPIDNPDHFEWAPCHQHYHFLNYANYRLLDGMGNEIATGHKQSFALIDLMQFLDNAGPGKYPLFDGTQGITVGWADVYSSGLDCQWIDITDVPAGDYQLEIEINFEQLIPESDYANNLILLDVTIAESDPPPPEVPAEWTCDPGFYSTNDGCDCGCGAFDPDCVNPTADACEYCGEDGSCDPGDKTCTEIQPANNALCQ